MVRTGSWSGSGRPACVHEILVGRRWRLGLRLIPSRLCQLAPCGRSRNRAADPASQRSFAAQNILPVRAARLRARPCPARTADAGGTGGPATLLKSERAVTRVSALRQVFPPAALPALPPRPLRAGATEHADSVVMTPADALARGRVFPPASAHFSTIHLFSWKEHIPCPTRLPSAPTLTARARLDE